MGFQEILIILILALVVFGPKRLPELARWLGKGLAEFRKATNEIKSAVHVEEMKQLSRDLQRDVTAVYQVDAPEDEPDSQDHDDQTGDASQEPSADNAGDASPGITDESDSPGKND